MLFHHDPRRTDDELDALGTTARERWEALGGGPRTIELATELAEIRVGPR